MNLARYFQAFLLIPITSLSLCSPSAFADNPPQNTGLGTLFGSISGALNKMRAAAPRLSPNAQGISSSHNQANDQSYPTANMSDADKQLMAQGIWHDPATGLIWSRCSLGQSWDGKTCIGTANKYNWKDANAATKQSQLGGYHDWRLPSIEDLYSLLRCANGFHNTADMPTNSGKVKQVQTYCNKKLTSTPQYQAETPLINYDQQIFPNSPDRELAYWSSTANLDWPKNSPLAWIMDFEIGNPTYGPKEVYMQFVRPIRNSY